MCVGNSSYGKRQATHFADGGVPCQPELEHLGDSPAPVKLEKAARLVKMIADVLFFLLANTKGSSVQSGDLF